MGVRRNAGADGSYALAVPSDPLSGLRYGQISGLWDHLPLLQVRDAPAAFALQARFEAFILYTEQLHQPHSWGAGHQPHAFLRGGMPFAPLLLQYATRAHSSGLT